MSGFQELERGFTWSVVRVCMGGKVLWHFVCVDKDLGQWWTRNTDIVESCHSVKSVECIGGIYQEYCFRFRLLQYSTHGMDAASHPPT